MAKELDSDRTDGVLAISSLRLEECLSVTIDPCTCSPGDRTWGKPPPSALHVADPGKGKVTGDVKGGAERTLWEKGVIKGGNDEDEDVLLVVEYVGGKEDVLVVMAKILVEEASRRVPTCTGSWTLGTNQTSDAKRKGVLWIQHVIVDGPRSSVKCVKLGPVQDTCIGSGSGKGDAWIKEGRVGAKLETQGVVILSKLGEQE
ncbi:hypothetical protein OF83DRAFT_1085956 [Amylostereum chailletii]|nr:hypothetical protein OF83DRAFT_1085956 [Amylostereum chailletii]